MAAPVYVFRNHAPRGYLGRLCTIVQRPQHRTSVWRTGTETILVEFDGGEQLACIRSAVVPVDSRLGRQALRVARLSGGEPVSRQRLRTLRLREGRAAR